MPLLPESDYGSWEEHTGEDGQKYWLFKDIYGREWDISPNFKVNHVYPDTPPDYNAIDYEDVQGNRFQDWDDENGVHHSEYWDPEEEWYYPYGPGTDYPDVEPMDITSQPQEPPSPYDDIEQEDLAKDHLPPPWIEGEEDHTGGRLPLPDDTPIQAKDNLAQGHLPGLLAEEQQQAEERARAEEAQNPTPPADPPPTPPQNESPVDPNADRQPPEEPPPSPTPEDLGIQEHYAKDHGLPGLVEEPAAFYRPAEPTVQPTPPGTQSPEGGSVGMGVPYQDYIPFFPMIQDPITGEWRNAQPGEIPGLGEGGAEEPVPPGTQTPEAEPPVQPTTPGDGEGGSVGMGVPYQDYIPFFPMVQDPATGEWRNMEPEEIEGPQSSGPSAPQMLSNLFDPNAEGPTLVPSLFNPNASGPTLDPRLLLDPDSPVPSIDPALLDPSAPGPTIDPALLDPNSPGPTLDPAQLDPAQPGPTLDPNQLDPSAPGETIDPAQLEHGIVQPIGGDVADPAANVMGHPFTHPILTDAPTHPEPSTPGHEHDDVLDLG